MVLLLAAGCGGDSSKLPKLAPVTGTVTLDGQPLAGATVTLTSTATSPATGLPPAEGAPSFGVTDEQGRFTLKYQGRIAGAIPGPCTISISKPQDFTDSKGNPDPAGEETLPARYNTNSKLTKTVVEGEPNEFNFDLTSKTKPKRRR